MKLYRPTLQKQPKTAKGYVACMTNKPHPADNDFNGRESREWVKFMDHAAELARTDARIAELERESEQWRDELRIYRETENKRIAELEQSVTVRDTEVARLRDALDQSALEYAELTVSAKSLEEHLHALVEVSEDSTIARARAVMNGDDIGEDADEARAGNGGGV